MGRHVSSSIVEGLHEDRFVNIPGGGHASDSSFAHRCNLGLLHYFLGWDTKYLSGPRTRSSLQNLCPNALHRRPFKLGLALRCNVNLEVCS
jgi:hypothetical protein